MTPEEAKALLDGTTMGPWENTTGWSVDKTTGPHGEQGCGHIAYATSRQDADLIAAAPALAELAAGLRYEYAVQEDVGYWRQRGEWFDTFEEAADYRDMKREDASMCIVRRLVGDPEVVS